MNEKPKIYRFLSVPKAANLLGLSQPTLKKLLRDRKIPYFIYGRCIRISEDDIKKFQNDSRVEK